MYSRHSQTTKFESLLIDDYPESYKQRVRRTLLNMGSTNRFPKQYTIA